jgi:DNA polymerase IIIc chi subunit
MAASSRLSSYHYVVDEPLLRTITAEIQVAIPGAEEPEQVNLDRQLWNRRCADLLDHVGSLLR